MLFNNYELYSMPEKGPISREALKEAFPEIYDSNGTMVKAIKLQPLESRFKIRQKVRDDDHNRKMGHRRVSPAPTGHKAVAKLSIEGRQVFLQWSESMPDVGLQKKSFQEGQNRIKIGKNFTIQPWQEDLLFLLYFGAGYIKNGGAQRKSGNPLYEFDRPAVRAAEIIKKDSAEWNLKDMIYHKLSESKIKSIMKGLGLKEKESIDESRILLFSRVKSGNELYREKFDELLSSQKEDNGEPEIPISQEIKQWLDEGKIKEVDGEWFEKDKRGSGENFKKTPFYKNSETGATAIFVLEDHLKENKTLLDNLRK